MFGKNGGDKFALIDAGGMFTGLLRGEKIKQLCFNDDNGAQCGTWCPLFHIRDNSDGCVVMLQCAAQPTEIWITR